MKNYRVKHLPDQKRFETTVDGFTGYVEYEVNSRVFDVIHTVVPKAIGGRGVAAALVKEAYAYAQSQGFETRGSCSFAALWLQRNSTQ